MKMRDIQVNKDRPSVMEIRWLFYFGWLPRFTVHYRTDRVDFADPLIMYAMNEMGLPVLPEFFDAKKDISDSTIGDFIDD